MKIDNKKIIDALENTSSRFMPLTESEIDKEYQYFLDIKKNRQVFPSSWNYKNYSLIKSNIFMFNFKKVSAYALIAVIGTTFATYGVGRVSAMSLANQISNAKNIAEFTIDISYSNVLLHGKNVTKDYVAQVLKSNENKIQVIGGSTGYKGEHIESAKFEASITGESNFVPAKPLPTGVSVTYVNSVEAGNVVGTSSERVIATAEDFSDMTGVSIEEAKRMEEEAKKNPYGPGFNVAVKFLELKEGDKTTLVGVDDKNVIVFFTEI